MLAEMTTSPDYLTSLNPAQRLAVETVDGPLLVLSGAGTGKTKVLTARIAHILMQKKAFPSQILAVTFTNKAAKEMVLRVEQNIGAPTAGLWLGTFHAIGARMLRRHAEYIGLSRDFTIINTDDQLRVIKQVMEELHIDDKRFPAKIALSLIQAWKDRALTPEKVAREKEAGFAGNRLQEIYTAYQRRLQTLNTVDFGDLTLHCITLFNQQPQVLEEYANRFRYMLVDEYQDTNIAQYLWLRLLAMGHKNLCCVGDDDQSIYSWRGAEVGNILRFEQDFPGAGVIRLEENYRSTPHILAVASALIANNKERLGKQLFTSTASGEKVIVRALWDEKDEARMVADTMDSLARRGHSLDTMAVLVRAGFQTRAFEEQFISEAVPYRVIGGLRFYERKEVRDILAYLRLIQQPNDDLAFERIINTPKRGIGAATLEKITTQAREESRSALKTAQKMIEEKAIAGKSAAVMKQLFEMFDEWRQQLLQEHPLDAVVQAVVERTGYRAMLEEERTEEARGRLENLKELIRSTAEYPSLAAFLDHVGLVADREDPLTEKQPMVTLMTMHAAKGLEFETVFLPGWEEGLFPHQRAMDESGLKGLEEERRLAYVGITRARERAIISHASSRRVHHQWQACVPSRFLDELPSEHLEVEEALPRHHGNLQRQIESIMQGRGAGSVSTSSPPPRKDGFFVGCKIHHPTFGTGRVLAIEGERLNICFEKGGIKKMMQEFVKLA
jgi:DNA helicase-2/ATP-dependent DNA helicase PcrA